MKKALALFVGICLVVAGGFAQKMLTTDDVLAGARQDAAVLAQAGHLEFSRQVNPRLPFLDRVGLRTQTDRLELDRQRYAARISTNGIGEIRAERRYQRANLAVAESRQRLLWHEALVRRYEALLNYRVAEHEIDLLRQFVLVYEDKTTVLKTRAAAGADTDVDNLIEAEYDRDEAALRLASAERLLEETRQALTRFVPGSDAESVLDTDGFLPPEKILLVAASISDQASGHPEHWENTARITRVEAQYLAEKARSAQLLDFVQIRHDNRPSEPLSRDISFALGINLPFRGTSTYKIAELKIEKNALEAEALQEQAEAERRVQEARSQVAALDARYRQAKRQASENVATYALEQARSGSVSDPMTLLRAKELLLKRRQRLLDIEAEMYARYLDLLESSGNLSAEPLVNYLADRW